MCSQVWGSNKAKETEGINTRVYYDSVCVRVCLWVRACMCACVEAVQVHFKASSTKQMWQFSICRIVFLFFVSNRLNYSAKCNVLSVVCIEEPVWCRPSPRCPCTRRPMGFLFWNGKTKNWETRCFRNRDEKKKQFRFFGRFKKLFWPERLNRSDVWTFFLSI